VQGSDAEELRTELAALDVAAELRQTGFGSDVAEHLDTIANEVDADVIVIGLRRRTPVGKLILGSAASRILLSVSRPVLAVKP
jgi:nucleotide-binding universal stress UspA family protein